MVNGPRREMQAPGYPWNTCQELGIFADQRSRMPLFLLNLFNDVDTCDEEGRHYSDLAEAKEAAISGARALMADHIQHGRPIHLHHRIEVTDEAGKVLAVIPFRELITILD